MIISPIRRVSCMLLDALGLRRPGYGHVGLLVGEDGAPLSKRHGSTSAQEFRARGFLSAAILNQLFRLGHAAISTAGCRPPRCPRISARSISGARRRASMSRNCCTGRRKPCSACPRRKSAPGWAATTATEFVELGAPQRGAARPMRTPWRAVVRGDLAAVGRARAAASLRRQAPSFSPRPPLPSTKPTPDLKVADQDSQGTHRAQRRGSIHAAAEWR